MRNTNYLVPIICLIMMAVISLTSCKKDEYEPWVNVPDQIDTTMWQDGFSDGGTLPNVTGTDNKLNGTKWVVTYVVVGFNSGQSKNDTLHFISNNTYTINSDVTPRGYTLSILPSSVGYSLTLNYFDPFGGLHYSGTVGYYFDTYGEIGLSTIFKDTTSKQAKGIFKKI